MTKAQKTDAVRAAHQRWPSAVRSPEFAGWARRLAAQGKVGEAEGVLRGTDQTTPPSSEEHTGKEPTS